MILADVLPSLDSEILIKVTKNSKSGFTTMQAISVQCDAIRSEQSLRTKYIKQIIDDYDD